MTVTLNRAAKKNAFNAELIGALRDAFETLRDQEKVRVVFVRGDGGTFSAGADLEWMRDAVDHTEEDNRDDAMQMALMLKHLFDIPALTVALVEGGAFGGGVGLAAACDMAIATQDAKFSFSEVRLGLIAATISPYVVAAVGSRRARRLFSTGRGVRRRASPATSAWWTRWWRTPRRWPPSRRGSPRRSGPPRRARWRSRRSWSPRWPARTSITA